MLKMPQKQQILFERVGGEATIAELIHDFYDRVLADPEPKPFFKHTFIDKLRILSHFQAPEKTKAIPPVGRI